jgi:hypothetical protein
MIDQEREALKLINAEITNWELGEVNITDRVSFLMKNIIKNCRKNYFGVFDQQNDPTTKKKKVFVPLTEYLVEDIIKNIDIDTSDIRVKAKNPSVVGVAAVFRYVLKHFLDKIQFGKLLNNIIRMVAIDGTCIVKSWKDGKNLRSKIVDRLNFIADPSANSLDETPMIERHLLTLPEFRAEAKKGKWFNVDKVYTTELIDRSGFGMENTQYNKTEIPMVEIYERYGWMPKSILTGNETDDYVYGVIISSGTGDSAVCHFYKEVKDHPYTLFRFKDIWNRLDGRGIGEMVYNLQAYVNEVVNTRINKHRISQLGLWKLRGGVTPQQFSKLFTTHAIKLKSQRDDVEIFNVGDADQSTYKDEQIGKRWAMDLSGVFDRGEVTASTPATNALIQERGSSSRSNLVQENLGFSISELIEKKYLPIIRKILRPGDVVRITGNPADLQRIQKKPIENEVHRAAQEAIDSGQIVTEEMMDQSISKLTEDMNSFGEDRFIKLDSNVFDDEYEIDIQIGNEELNPALVAQSITQALGIAAQYPGSRLNIDEALREIFDVLGLDGERLINAEQELGVPQAQLAQAQEQAKMGGQAINEATANPTPMSRPVV